jgi:deoxycytidine triphosphate deaminase
MSVIPFVMDTERRTVISTKDDFKREGHLVLIEDMDPEQAQDFRNKDSLDANTSYDLTVGNEYIDLRDKSKHGVSKDHPLFLSPGAAVIIETAEHIHLPRSRFGHIVPKVSMLHDGITNTSSKVDPGYEGKLSIAVFNLGKKTIEIKWRAKFCTLYILETADGTRPYRKPAKSLPGHLRRDYPKLIYLFMRRHGWLFALAASILSLFKK